MGGRCLAFVLIFTLGALAQNSLLMDFRFETAGPSTLNYQRWTDRVNGYEAWNGLHAHPDNNDATWIANRAGLYFSSAPNPNIVRISPVPAYDNDATVQTEAPLLFQNFTFVFWVRMNGASLSNGAKLLVKSTHDLTTTTTDTELITLEQTGTDVLRLRLAFLQYDGSYFASTSTVTTSTTIAGTQTWDRWFHLAVVVQYEWEPAPVTRGYIYIDGVLRSPKYFESGSRLSPSASSIIQYYRDTDSLMSLGAKLGSTNWVPTNALNQVIVNRFQLYGTALSEAAIKSQVYFLSAGNCVGSANLNAVTNPTTKCLSCPAPDSGSGPGLCQFEKCTVGQYLNSLQVCVACQVTTGTCTGSGDSLSCYSSGNFVDGVNTCTACNSCCDTCLATANQCYGCHKPTGTSPLFSNYTSRYTCAVDSYLTIGTQVNALVSMPTPSTWSVLFWVRGSGFTTGGILDLGTYKFDGQVLSQGTTTVITLPLATSLPTGQWVHVAFTASASVHNYYLYQQWSDAGAPGADVTSNTVQSVGLSKLTICYSLCTATTKAIQVWGTALTYSQIQDYRYMIWRSPRPNLIFMMPLNEGSGSPRSTVGPGSNAIAQNSNWQTGCGTSTFYHAFQDSVNGATSNIMLCPDSSNPVKPVARYSQDKAATCPYRLKWTFNNVCYGDTIADTEHGTLLMRGNSTTYQYNQPYVLNTNAGLYFDGVNDLLTLPNFPGSGVRFELLSSFTFLLWIYPLDKHTQYVGTASTNPFTVDDWQRGLVSAAFSTGQAARAFYIDGNGKLAFKYWGKGAAVGPTGFTSTLSVTKEKWQLVAVSGYLSINPLGGYQMNIFFYQNDQQDTTQVATTYDLSSMLSATDDMIVGALLEGTGPYAFYRGFLYEVQIYNTYLPQGPPLANTQHQTDWFYIQNLYTKLTYPLSSRVDFVPVGMTQALSWQANTGQDVCFPIECATRLPYCDRNECCTSCDTTSCLSGGQCITPPVGQFRHPDTSVCTYPLEPTQPLYALWRDFSIKLADLWQPEASHVTASMHRKYIFVFDVRLEFPVFTFQGFCSSYFAASSANSFGDGASCFFSNATTITVYLGSEPTILANDTLFLADGVFRRVDEPLGFYTTGAFIALELPHTPIKSVAAINAPAIASLCRPLTIDALHSWPMVNSKFYWSTSGAMVESAPGPTFTLAATQPGLLNVQLLQVNMFGVVDQTSVTIEIVVNPVPQVSFPTNRLYITRDQGIVQIPVVVTHACGSSSQKLSYRWSIVEATGDVEVWYQKLGGLTNTLVADPLDLEPGQQVLFRVEVVDEKLPQNIGAGEILIIESASSLRPAIRGGNREVYYQDDVLLSALSSFDPDVTGYTNYHYDTAPLDSAISVLWECYYRNGTVTYPCGILPETRFSLAVLTQPDLVIPGGTLLPDISYTFVLWISKDTRKAATSTKIDVVSSPRANIWLNPYFYSLITSGSSGNVVNSTWSAVGVSPSSIISTNLINRSFAILDFSSWPILTRYQLTLEVYDDSGLYGKAFITIENNVFPRHGSLQVVGAGRAYHDTFTLQMTDWFDEFLPLTYTFSRTDQTGSSFLISTRSIVGSLNTYLTNGASAAVGKVFNSLGVSTPVSVPLAVSYTDPNTVTQTPIAPVTNQVDELMSLFSLYAQLYRDTQSVNVLVWTIDIAGVLLSNPTCEVVASITEHAHLVGLDNADFLARYQAALSADQSFGCVDVASAFDLLTQYLSVKEVSDLMGLLGKSALAWAVPQGDPIVLQANGLVVSFSRSWSLQDSSVLDLVNTTDPAFGTAGAKIVESVLQPGCLDVITIASYSQLNAQPVYDLELRDVGYSSVKVGVLDLSLSYGCQINKFGEIEFSGLPIWGFSPLISSSSVSLSYITYYLPYTNYHEEESGLVRCVQWNGMFWTESSCASGDVQFFNSSHVTCTCSKLLPTSARVVEPYTRFDVNLPQFTRVQYFTMFQHFNPIHVLIIIGCLFGAAASFAVYADLDAHKNPPEETCLSFYKEESLYISVFYAFKPELTRLARVMIIFVKWFFMLFVLGIWYYHQRRDMILEYYEPDAGMAGVVVVLAFIVHGIFNHLLNSNRMHPCICIGYVLALVFVGAGIIVTFAITRRLAPLTNGLWVISFLTALAMDILVADPCMVGLKAAIESLYKK